MKTRKDFVAMAKVIREVKAHRERARLTLKFEKQFAADNPRFDRSRWRKACGYSVSAKRSKRQSGKTNSWFSDFFK